MERTVLLGRIPDARSRTTKMRTAAIPEHDLKKLRDELVSFLHWRRAPRAEDLAQEALLRVLQKLREGQQIYNLAAYARRVAEIVRMEDTRLHRLETGLIVDRSKEVDDRTERLSLCLAECKQKCLSRRDVKFIEQYYESNAEQRKLLAKAHNISSEQLRKQAMQIRSLLRQCVERCMRNSEL